MQVEKEKSIYQSHYCHYYKAHVIREQVWFFVAIMRSYEHVAFDRTLDKQDSIFEFFVPIDTEPVFLDIMSRLTKLAIVTEMHTEENRLKYSSIL